MRRGELLTLGLSRLSDEIRKYRLHVCEECRGEANCCDPVRPGITVGAITALDPPVVCRTCNSTGLMQYEYFGMNESESRLIPVDDLCALILLDVAALKIVKPKKSVG